MIVDCDSNYKRADSGAATKELIWIGNALRLPGGA
jgi:hypothetical protein